MKRTRKHAKKAPTVAGLTFIAGVNNVNNVDDYWTIVRICPPRRVYCQCRPTIWHSSTAFIVCYLLCLMCTTMIIACLVLLLEPEPLEKYQ